MDTSARKEKIVDHAKHIYTYSADNEKDNNKYEYIKLDNCSYIIRSVSSDIIENYNNGCLPSMYHNHFEMRRSIRVCLNNFVPTSEHRRVNRKINDKYKIKYIDKCNFTLWDDEDFINQCVNFGEKRYTFGGNITKEKINDIKNNKLINKVLIFYNDEITLGYSFLCDYFPVVHWWFSFYNLHTRFDCGIPLGKFIMGKIVEFFYEKGYDFVYLGTAYNNHNTYKIKNWNNVEYWDGNHFIKVKKHDKITWG